MPNPRFLSHNDRRYRREKMVAAFRRSGNPRTVAEQFGVSASLVYRALRNVGLWHRQRRG